MDRLFSLTRALVARKRKIFALFFALAASIGLSWAETTTVTWDSNTLSSIDKRNGESFTEGDVTVTVLDGKIDGQRGSWKGNSVDASFKFSTSSGNFTRIEITGVIRGLGGSGWTEASPGAVWTGDANETTFGMYFRDVTQIVFTIENAAPAITKTITDNGMTYDIYDNGVVKVSGTGIAAARIFAANDHDYVTSVKRFEFADDCKVYSFGENWYMCYMSNSPLEAVDIKTTLPFVAGRSFVFYRKESGSDESVTVTITAPAIASINRDFVANYGTPQHIIFNMPVTTFEKGWCNYLSEKDTVTIPTGSLYHLPASYVFKDEYLQDRYDDMAADGVEDMFWQYEASGLVEGVDYTRTEEKTGVITAENDSIVFGKAVVKYQAPQEAPATSWTLWRSDDFKTFPELEKGSSHTCKDVTLKIVDGSFDMSGSNISLFTSATNGIQLIAPKGKIFKQVIALDRDLRTSLIWTGEADTVGISSDLIQISLIEFELDAAPSSVTLPESVAGLVYTGEAQTLVTAGEVTGFTFQYKIGDAAYSADLPTATDAGSYTVYYKATNGNEEQDITGSVDVSIAKADINLGGSEGVLKGKFSVADDKVVCFSQGNLKYTRSTGKFEFMTNQYDMAETYNQNVGDDYASQGVISLFGWATSNINTPANTYYYPWETDKTNASYGSGITSGNVNWSDNINEFANYDWGANTGDLGTGWRTLTKDEWVYLFNTRTVNGGTGKGNSYTVGQSVNGTLGVVLYPDNYTGAVYTTGSDWSTFEDAGCVFLPAAGFRVGTSVSGVGSYGRYWSSTSNSGTDAYSVNFDGSSVLPASNSSRGYGFSVRLVTEIAPASSVTLPQAVEELVYTSEEQALISAGKCADGTFQYKVGENGTWVDTLPKVTDAGTYQVYYKIQGDANHNDYIAAEPLEVSIAKAALTITAENKEVVYGYAAPGFSVSYSGLQGSDLPADVLTGELSYACDYTAGSNAGEYDITPSGQTSANYDITYVKGKLVVYKADPAFTAPTAITLTYNGGVQTLIAAGTTEHGTFEYTFTPNDEESWNTALPQAKNADTYGVYYRVVGDANHNDYESADAVVVTIAKAALTATADDKSVIYGDDAPEYTVTYEGWQGEDNADVLSGTIAYACEYAPTSNVGEYDIIPSGVSNPDYAITFVNGKVTVNKAVVKVAGAEAQIAKFEDGNTNAVVLNAGQLEGIKLNDAVAHETTASFSDASVGEGKTITLFYELTGDAALLANYDLTPASDVFTAEGVIIEKFIPDNNPDEKEDDEAQIEEGIEVYAYGYCDGSGYSLRYHLNSGNPDQYKIDFDDSRFEDVNWTNLTTPGKDGTIDIEIPVDMPTGDYTFTATFRDSRFDWLESNALNVTFHVNLPETYVTPMFDNTIALVDTCNCFTDIQWYHRADASEAWQPIAGATGYYYRPADGSKLTGEFFVQAKMNGVPTYTCGQADMQTLYGADKQQKAIVKAFPNPVVNTTTVSIEHSDNWEHALRVVNLMGVEIINTTFEGDRTTIDLDGHAQGNYMISVDGIVVKVMKQ